MLVRWVHYGNDQPCGMCSAMVGQVFEDDYLGYLGPPLHPHDHCALVPVAEQPPPEPTTIDWSGVRGALRKAWIRLTAWFLRREEGFHLGPVVPLPPILEALREEAEKYNEEREAEGVRSGREEEDGEIGDWFMPGLKKLENADGSHIRLNATLLLGESAPEHRTDYGLDRIPMRFVRAGQSMPIRGFPRGVIFSAEALRAAAAAGRFDGAGVFFQHVDSGRDVRDLAGVTAGAVFDEETESVIGLVHLYGNQAGRELQALASDFRRHREEGIPHPDIGVSIDSFFVFEKSGDVPRAVRMSELLSVDVVFRPAADGRILASNVPEQGGISMLTRERIEEVLEEHQVPDSARRVLLTAEYADEEALLQAIEAAQQPANASGRQNGSHSASTPAQPSPVQVQGAANDLQN